MNKEYLISILNVNVRYVRKMPLLVRLEKCKKRQKSSFPIVNKFYKSHPKITKYLPKRSQIELIGICYDKIEKNQNCAWKSPDEV